MAEESLLSDELLHQLMAVGQVDILVGIPTLNNAGTIASVVRAVHQGFARYFLRERTVLLNTDGGSDDGTPAVVRDAAVGGDDTVTVTHSLRTMHRITTPYHGLKGKRNALHQIFTAADLLQARAVIVLDPEVESVTPEWIVQLARPVLTQGMDFVAPMHARHPIDAPLVGQLVRPLVRATYGWQVSQPLAGEFGCSGRFVLHCLEQTAWTSTLADYAIDPWIVSTAMARPFRACQAPLGPRVLGPRQSRPPLAQIFQQVVGSVFDGLVEHARVWLDRTGSEPWPMTGQPPAFAGEPPALEADRLVETFCHDIGDLEPVLAELLAPQTLAGVRQVTSVDCLAVRYPDDLWVATLYDMLVAYHRVAMTRDHITQTLLPLYLGRTGAFFLENRHAPPERTEAALENLAQAFERGKPALVERWQQVTTR